ncbi:proline-rich protein 36-like isoform X1 [Drosophila simulans]|uniref:proline-rich protein 36-like isoform X1 n=1 Tax=Drosophila simulans TaxID=7240 RepID=UPI00192CF185|nr:proline-rich protein 36-like isoform X1 [Drosophila simulans]
MEHSNGSSKPSTDQSAPPHPQSSAVTASSEVWSSKRKLYAIDEREESSPVTVGKAETDLAYDADVDELEQPTAEREIIYELFQPWALSTYGDQAKTKTITLRKKARILKALEGKEHSRPDSSKFRFWVKTKGFTTNRPEGFEEAPGSRRYLKSLPSSAILSDNPADVDLFAASTSKGFGRRTYRKVACVEEFFDIIYNVHMELGGRSGMHAGQKRTYRIITETYAFLPREAVTRFLTICPECKKNLRPSSPSGGGKDSDMAGNESSSEVETYLNYSSHTESSLEAGPTAKRRRHSSAEIKASLASGLAVGAGIASSTSATQLDVLWTGVPRSRSPKPPMAAEAAVEATPVSVPKIRIKTQLQRPSSPQDQSADPSTGAQSQSQVQPQSQSQSQSQSHSQPSGQGFDAQLLKSRDNLLRYYHFMRRFYAGEPVLAPPIYGSSLLQSLSYPTTISTAATATPTTPTTTTSAPGKMLAPPKAATPPPNPPKIKSSPDSLLRARTPPVASTATSAAPKDTAHTPINLTKSIFSSLKTGHAPSTSTPVPLKLELPSPPKPLPELRIPQLRGMPPVELSLPLPPLDLERLKPITSTYLQLTRSMGLSDEDALRFDNLVSKDFKYSL